MIMQQGKILCPQTKIQLLGSLFNACLNTNQILRNKLFAPDISWPIILRVREKFAHGSTIANWWNTWPSAVLPERSWGGNNRDLVMDHVGGEFGLKVSAKIGWSNMPIRKFSSAQKPGLVAEILISARWESDRVARLPFQYVKVTKDSKWLLIQATVFLYFTLLVAYITGCTL